MQGDIDWPRHYAALLRYKEEHGHCNVSRSVTCECVLPGKGDDGVSDYEYRGKLGEWVHTQRSAKKGQGGCKLTPEREALLQKLVDEGDIAIFL